MERVAYDLIDKLESEHWWFAGRRNIIDNQLSGLNLINADILEVGAGMGGNLPMLQQFGRVDAIEMDEQASQVCAKKTGVTPSYGMLPDQLCLDKEYDLIVLLDVLEHIKEDKQALERLHQALKPGGYLLITVPAQQWLFGPHDVANHHFRRYSKRLLNHLLRETNFHIRKSTYFNTFLSPLALPVVLTEKLTGKMSKRDQMPPTWQNAMLKSIFTSERHFLHLINLPFGLSLLAIAQKKA